MCSNNNFTDLTSTGVVLTYIYQGYVLKVPVFTTDQGDNPWGLGMTVGLFAAANFAAYKNLQYMKNKKPVFTRGEYNIAFGHYQQHTEKLQAYIRESVIFLV